MSGSNHNPYNSNEMYSNGYANQYGQQQQQQFGQYPSTQPAQSSSIPYYQHQQQHQQHQQQPSQLPLYSNQSTNHYAPPQSNHYQTEFNRRYSGESISSYNSHSMNNQRASFGGQYHQHEGMSASSSSYGLDRRSSEGSYHHHHRQQMGQLQQQQQIQLMGQNYQNQMQSMGQNYQVQPSLQEQLQRQQQQGVYGNVPNPPSSGQTMSANNCNTASSQMNLDGNSSYTTTTLGDNNLQNMTEYNGGLNGYSVQNGTYHLANSSAALTNAPAWQMNTNVTTRGAFQPQSSSDSGNTINQAGNSSQWLASNNGQLQQNLVAKAPATIISAYSRQTTPVATAAAMSQSVNVSQHANNLTSQSQKCAVELLASAVQSANSAKNTASVLSSNTAASVKATANPNPVKSTESTSKQSTPKATPVIFPNVQRHVVPKQTSTPAPKPPKSNKSPKTPTPPNRIEIPTQFPPLHCYRATAAYSLLRTLSKELRLSPFTLQSFLSALMLPIPSRLLGEVHVRVMRVLFANIGMGSYGKLGRGDGPIFLKRAKRNILANDAEDDEIAEEFVRARGCDNLYYLDSLTWPLFYEDYVIATEGKFVDEMADKDEFIDGRSAAMISDEADSNVHQMRMQNRSQIPPYPGEGWIDRCPVGPFGRRDPTTGRFVCCPFHIHAAWKKFQQGPLASANSTAAPLPKKRKRSKIPKKYTHDGSSSDYSNDSSDSDSDEDFVSNPKKPKGTGKRGRPRKYPKDEPTSTPPAKTSTPKTNSIKGSRVMDVQAAPRIPGSRVGPSATVPRVHDPKQSMPVSSFKPVAQPPTYHPSTAISHPNAKPTTQFQPNVAHHPNYIPNPIAQQHAVQLEPILVPPIPPQPVDLNAMMVSKDSDVTITRFFLEGDLFQTKAVATGVSATDDAMTIVDEPPNLFGFQLSNKDDDLIHMAPIEQLRKGIPYHHLSLEMKLAMLEFLLDELLSVDEIAKELTLRRQLTGQHHAPYGELPHPSEFDELVNEDECAICGLEGDLLCCDGCPGSFHKQCISMAPGMKLPEGKWLCTECRVADGSRMGPLRAESRPIIGWFSLSELEPSPQLMGAPHEINNSVSSLAQTQQYLLNSEHQSSISHGMPLQVQNAVHPHQIFLNSISTDVEFLVTTGKVFARHRHSHKRFDPFNPTSTTDIGKGQDTSLLQKPPEPLTTAQLMELLKRLGPQNCLKLPWRRLVFNPHKLFSDNSPPLQALVLHDKETRALMANHPETINPLEYDNKYRRAPPIPQVKHQLGQFVIPAFLPDLFSVAPKIASQFGLSLVNCLSLNPVMDNLRVGLAYQDVNQSLGDQLIKAAKLLFDARLIDYRWETIDRWSDDVRKAKSFSRLSALLVKLADACYLRAFQSPWYQVKHNENSSEFSRLTNTGSYSAIAESWTAEGELKLRKWQRCTKSNVLALLHSDQETRDSLKSIGSTAKRGKKNKVPDGGINPLAKTMEIEQQPQKATHAENNLSIDMIAATQVNSDPVVRKDATTATDSFGVPVKSEGAPVASEVKPKVSPSPATLGENTTTPPTNEFQLSPILESSANPCSSEEHAIGVEVSSTSTPPKSKSKKKRRTTRSLSPVPSAKKRCSDRLSVVRRQIEGLLGIGIDETTSQIDTEVHRLKLDALEDMLVGSKDTFFFAIAGKKLFEPEGSMSLHDVKRLARNAGTIRGPYIAYETPFEVGESTTCHYWRTMTLNAKTFEDFALSLKFFKEHIDQGAASSSLSLVNRLSKPDPPIYPKIRCERIDQMTGVKEYFIVNNKNQGKWQFEVCVDLPPFISYQIEKGRPYRDEYNKAQKSKMEAATKKRQEELKQIVEAKRAEDEKRKTEAQKRAIERATQNEKAKAETQKRILKRMAKESRIKAAKTPTYYAGVNPAVNPEQAFEAALVRHKESTLSLLMQSAARGENAVPVAAMVAVRNTTLAQLNTANLFLRNANGTYYSQDILKSKMAHAESGAIQKYVQHKAGGKS